MAARPPRELDGAEVLYYADVTASVKPTGSTRHVARGRLLGPAAALAISRYPGAEGFYLFYLSENGHVVTDTWHASVQAAFDQAAFEYEALKWTAVTPP